jgi:hypothetical protein
LAALPEHPAVSTRLRASNEGKTHDLPFRSVFVVIPLPPYQTAQSVIAIILHSGWTVLRLTVVTCRGRIWTGRTMALVAGI